MHSLPTPPLLALVPSPRYQHPVYMVPLVPSMSRFYAQQHFLLPRPSAFPHTRGSKFAYASVSACVPFTQHSPEILPETAPHQGGQRGLVKGSCADVDVARLEPEAPSKPKPQPKAHAFFAPRSMRDTSKGAPRNPSPKPGSQPICIRRNEPLQPSMAVCCRLCPVWTHETCVSVSALST